MIDYDVELEENGFHSCTANLCYRSAYGNQIIGKNMSWDGRCKDYELEFHSLQINFSVPLDRLLNC